MYLLSGLHETAIGSFPSFHDVGIRRVKFSLFPITAVFPSARDRLFRKILPRIAVVICGIDNIYNVPHPDVLKRYSLMGTKIFRTDKSGAVSIITYGKNMVPIVFRQ